MPVHFLDAFAVADLKTFLERAERLGAAEVQLRAAGGVLLSTVPVLVPAGLLDAMPTVLGMRTSAISPGESQAHTVAIRSILERIAHLEPGAEPAIEWPPAEVAAPWAGITAPQAGWQRIASIDATQLAEAARAGVAEVSAALPTEPGEAVVQQVRREVWGRRFGESTVPLGAAFAADALGFLAVEPAALFQSGRWLRLSTDRGHVLVRTSSHAV